MKRILVNCIICTLSVCMFLQVAQAKLLPDKITIAGTDIDSGIVVTDPEILQQLMLLWPHNEYYQKAQPMPTDSVYILTYYQTEGGQQNSYVLVYQPNSLEDSGIVYNHYLATLATDWKAWFYADPSGEAAIQELLQQQDDETVANN